ncbi:MAG: DUF3256 family protein [Bacteroidota bacterium]|nr:DUF3256 family protein [Bacteroidota bacterium]
MKKNRLQKNNWLVFCLLILFAQPLLSQTIEKCYVNMPDILNPTLTKQNRLELLEYHKAGQGDSVTNRFGHLAYLVSVDTLQQQIVVKNTPSSRLEMKILHLEDNTTVIGVIRTVCAPVCMSTVEFYDTAWHLIPLQFNMPKAIEWVDLKGIPAEKTDINWVKNLMDISFISLSFSNKGQFLIAKNNTFDFLSEEDRKVVAPYVNGRTILFKLGGRTWQRIQP